MSILLSQNYQDFLRVGIGTCSNNRIIVLVGIITISGISQSFAEKGKIPDWVKTTLSL